MDGCHCIIAKVAEGRNSIRERIRRHLSILKCGTKGEKFMKIATLLLFSVLMMSPSATLFSSPFQKDKPAEVDRADLPPFFAHGIIGHFLRSGLRLRTAEPVKRSRPQTPSSL